MVFPVRYVNVYRRNHPGIRQRQRPEPMDVPSECPLLLQASPLERQEDSALKLKADPMINGLT